MDSLCDCNARDTLARFVAYGGGGYTLNSNHPPMSMASSHTGVDCALDECLIVPIDTSKHTHGRAMYGEIYSPIHSGDRYRNGTIDLMRFGQPGVHLNPYVQMSAILNVSGDNIIPRVRHAANQTRTFDSLLKIKGWNP